MRVLQIIGSISPRNGGSKALLDMCRELRQLGVETHIATIDRDTHGRLGVPLGRMVDVHGAFVYHFSSPILTRYGFSWELGRWLRAHLAEYEVVHLHGFFLACLISAVPKAFRLHIPYIIRPMGHITTWSLRQSWIAKQIFLGAFERRYLNQAAAIHYTSRQEQEEAELLGIRAPGVVIPLGVNVDDFRLPPRGTFRKQYPEIGDRRIVLFLSRLESQEGRGPVDWGGQRAFRRSS